MPATDIAPSPTSASYGRSSDTAISGGYNAPVTSLLAVLLLAQSPGQPGLVEARVELPDRSTIVAFVHEGDLAAKAGAVRLSPKLAQGAFWSFGDTYQRVIWYGCEGGAMPILENRAALRCPDGAAPVLRPGVTMPADSTAHPNSNVPPVVPGGRPVTQSLHAFAPWILPCVVLIVLLVILGVFCERRARRAGFVPAVSLPPRLSRPAWAWLVGLTALAAGLRLYGLGFEPLEQNEFTYFMSGMGHDSPVDVVLDVNGMAQTHPPFFHLVSWVFAKAGNTETIARLPATLAGIATVPLMMLLAWRYTSGTLLAACIAGALACVSPAHAWYSQDASPYTFTVLFAVLTLLGGEAIARDPARKRPWMWLIVGTWGLVYTHYYGLHLAFALYLFFGVRAYAARCSASAYRAVAAGCVTWAGIVPWIPAFAVAYSWSRGHSTAYQRLIGVYHLEPSHAADALDLLRLTAGYPPEVAWLAIAGVALLAVHLWRFEHPRRWLILAPLAWFVPFELINRATFLQGLYNGWYFGLRYFLFLFPVAWLLFATLAARPLPRLLRGVTWAFVAISLALGAFQTVRTLRVRNKPDVASAAALVRQNLKDGDAVIVGPAAFYQHPFHYYFAPPEQRAGLRINDFMQTPRWRQAGWVGVLSELFEPYERSLQSIHIRRVWVVEHTQHLLGRREFSDRPSNAITRTVEADFELAWSRNFHDTSVRLYTRRAEPQLTTQALHFGWSDGPFVRRFEPPWAYASPGRRVRPGSEVRFQLPQGVVARKLALRAGTIPPGGHQAVDAAAPDTSTLIVRLPGTPPQRLTLSNRFDWYPLTLAEPVVGELRVHFDLVRPAAGAGRPPEVVLDRLIVPD